MFTIIQIPKEHPELFREALRALQPQTPWDPWRCVASNAADETTATADPLDLRSALKRLIETQGLPAARGILEQFGVKRLSELEPHQHAPALRAIAHALDAGNGTEPLE
ncbi:hypothetical protein [Magnetofaba australis]|uniref:Uncharacterized protein n=1 Tax=Magnetofaba australis IT-1 TaxID=1434232 RepID=A0A1Y2JZ68_9PROT|nr:hypothetical protein [Magnetofaba australis]OSM00195.1 hypothetical protein MAIT1_00652 [Magnetofaba australis IT-1]